MEEFKISGHAHSHCRSIMSNNAATMKKEKKSDQFTSTEILICDDDEIQEFSDHHRISAGFFLLLWHRTPSFAKIITINHKYTNEPCLSSFNETAFLPLLFVRPFM